MSDNKIEAEMPRPSDCVWHGEYLISCSMCDAEIAVRKERDALRSQRDELAEALEEITRTADLRQQGFLVSHAAIAKARAALAKVGK